MWDWMAGEFTLVEARRVVRAVVGGERWVSISSGSLQIHHEAGESKTDEVSVAEFLPNFEPRVRKALRVLLGEKGEQRVRMGLAKDGSGVGGEYPIHWLNFGVETGRRTGYP